MGGKVCTGCAVIKDEILAEGRGVGRWVQDGVLRLYAYPSQLHGLYRYMHVVVVTNKILFASITVILVRNLVGGRWSPWWQSLRRRR